MFYYIEFEFGGEWIRLPREFKSRDDANWAIGKWKQANNAPGADRSFRVVEIG